MMICSTAGRLYLGKTRERERERERERGGRRTASALDAIETREERKIDPRTRFRVSSSLLRWSRERFPSSPPPIFRRGGGLFAHKDGGALEIRAARPAHSGSIPESPRATKTRRASGESGRFDESEPDLDRPRLRRTRSLRIKDGRKTRRFKCHKPEIAPRSSPDWPLNYAPRANLACSSLRVALNIAA